MKKLCVLVLLLLVPALAFGQADTTGRITGSVTDEDGQPVVGAIVTAQSPTVRTVVYQVTGDDTPSRVQDEPPLCW